MVAKNDEAHVSLVDQLVKKTVTRKYTRACPWSYSA